MGGAAVDQSGDPPHLGARGAGLFCFEASPRIVRCTFVRNGALEAGGAIDAIDTCDPLIINCKFHGNVSFGPGGAVMLEFVGSATLVNCIFSNNVSLDLGGALFADAECTPSITNCTFASNYAELLGGAVACEPTYTTGQTTLRNIIAWGNIPDDLVTYEPDPPVSIAASIAYCDIDGGVPLYFEDDGNNIDDDPEFVSSPHDGTDDIWATEDDDYGDLRLQSTSPCIDEADNASLPADFGDLNANTNFSERTPRDLDVLRKRVLEWTSGFIVDMGAYEFGCNENLDASNDCEIDGLDLAVLVAAWTGSGTYCSCPPYVQADLDEDCQINGDDLTILLAAYGKCDACDAEEFSGPQGEDPWYEQFLEWLAEQDWAAFLQWFAEQFG